MDQMDGRWIRSSTYQPHLNQASLANSKTAGGSEATLIEMDGETQFDGPDALIRAVAGQADRVVGRANGQSVSGESLSANAVRQMQAAAISSGGICHNKIMANHLASHQTNRAALFRQAPA